MHLVLLHGYLLRQTGSNMVVVNVAKTWAKHGYAVTVVCQDREAGTLDFVDEFISSSRDIPPHPPQPGQLRVVVPEIDGLLPVYVFDHYDGYEVKMMGEMSENEIEMHISMTAEALKKVCAQGVDRILANHALLSAVIAARATTGTTIPYDVKLHGSAMEFTLVPYPETMKYAVEGLAGARRIIAGTKYIQQRAEELFAADREKIGLDHKICVISLGFDPNIFYVSTDVDGCQKKFLDAVRQGIELNDGGRTTRPVPEPKGRLPEELHAVLKAAGRTYNQRAVDADLLKKWQPISVGEPVIIYFGKFLPSKGVGELMASVPAVLAEIPTARFIFVGFGSYREHLEGLLQAYAQGDPNAFSAYAQAGEFALETEGVKAFRALSPAELDRVLFTGILDHETLAHLLPLASVSVVPSNLAEAFGLVAVEAMASGVLPLCSYHSGLKDVIDEIAKTDSILAASMKLDPGAYSDLPSRIIDELRTLYPAGFCDTTHRTEMGRQLRRIAIEQFSWENTASRLAHLPPCIEKGCV